MDEKQALNIVRQACASIQADLATHQRIQQAIDTVDKALQKKNEEASSE